jgi:hypothetical protein
MRRALRVAGAAGMLAVLIAVGAAVGGSTFDAHPVPSSSLRPMSVAEASLSDVRASTTSDSRAQTECNAWLAVGGGGPADATLTSATDATAAQVRALLLATHRADAASDVNLSPLGPTDYVAVCVFDVSGSSGFGKAKQLVTYATPENQGIGLISLG